VIDLTPNEQFCQLFNGESKLLYSWWDDDDGGHFVLVQAHWIKSLQVDMSLQSDMLFWFWDSKSFLLILSDAYLGEKQQILFSHLPINATSGHLYGFDVIWCIILYFPYAGFSTRKQNWGEVSLQIPSSFSALYSDPKV